MTAFSFPLDTDSSGQRRIPIIGNPPRRRAVQDAGISVPVGQIAPPYAGLRNATGLAGGTGFAPPAPPPVPAIPANTAPAPLTSGQRAGIIANVSRRNQEASFAENAGTYGMEHGGVGKQQMGLTEEQARQMMNVIAQQNPGIHPSDLLPQFAAKMGEYGIDQKTAVRLHSGFRDKNGNFQFDFPGTGGGTPPGPSSMTAPTAPDTSSVYPMAVQTPLGVGSNVGGGRYQFADGRVAISDGHGGQLGPAIQGPRPTGSPVQIPLTPTPGKPPPMGPEPGYTPISSLMPATAAGATAAGAPATQQAQRPAAGPVPAMPIDPRVAANQIAHARDLRTEADMIGAPVLGANYLQNRQIQAAVGDASAQGMAAGVQENGELRKQNQQLMGMASRMINTTTMADRMGYTRGQQLYQSQLKQAQDSYSALENELKALPPSQQRARKGELDAARQKVEQAYGQYQEYIRSAGGVGAPASPAAPAVPAIPASTATAGGAASASPSAMAQTPAGAMQPAAPGQIPPDAAPDGSLGRDSKTGRPMIKRGGQWVPYGG